MYIIIILLSIIIPMMIIIMILLYCIVRIVYCKGRSFRRGGVPAAAGSPHEDSESTALSLLTRYAT